ncbi:MAG: FixH family protein [Phycisphaerales bacterium]
MSERWPKVVFGLLGLNVVIVAVTVYAANSDPAFGVEPGYDSKAMAWDAVKRERAISKELGWIAQAEINRDALVVRLSDAKGEPIVDAAVRAEVFHTLRSSERHAGALVESERGVYRGEFGLSRPGRWEVRLIALRGAQRFVADVAATRDGTP